MKNVTNAGSSVSNQLARAKKKWWKLKLDTPVRVVFTTYRCNDTFDDVLSAIQSKSGYDEAIVVSANRIELITK